MTKAQLRKHFDYRNDGALICKTIRSRHTYPGKVLTGTLKENGYTDLGFLGKLVKFHHAVYIWHYGGFKGFIDHVNGDRSDNRIENLRVADRRQNAWNMKCRSTSRSGIKGLTWSKSKQMWTGSVSKEGKRKWVSSICKEKTIYKLKNLRQQMHGDFARHY